MRDRLVSRRIDALHQCFLVIRCLRFLQPKSIFYLQVQMLHNTRNHDYLMKLEDIGFLVLLPKSILTDYK